MAAPELPATDSTAPGFAGTGKMGVPESPKWHLRSEGGSGNHRAPDAYLEAKEGSRPLTLGDDSDRRCSPGNSTQSRGFLFAREAPGAGMTPVLQAQNSVCDSTFQNHKPLCVILGLGMRPRKAGILKFTSDMQLNLAHICLSLEQSAFLWNFLHFGSVSGNSALLGWLQ